MEYNSIICLQVLEQVNAYVKHAASQVEITEEDAPDGISITSYAFPDSFLEFQNNESEELHKIQNEIYKKLHLEQKVDKLEYHFVRIQYYKKPDELLKEYYSKLNTNKTDLYNFFIFFCKTSNSDEINDFRIVIDFMYDFVYITEILNATYLDVNDLNNYQLEILAFVLEKTCTFLQIAISEGIALPSEILQQKKSEELLHHFQEFLELTNRGNIDIEELTKQFKILFDSKTEESLYIYDDNFEFLLENNNYWHSDWKFDPEDAEYFIGEMLGEEDFTFDYPEETYSHDLFPYIQSELEKRNLKLMTFETYGDSYLFFLANKEDVGRILELSELTKLEVVKL